MKKFFFSLSILILATGCFTIGKVGYIVPATHDDSELSDDIIGEECAIVVTNILNDLNKDLEKKGKTGLSNVGLKFTNSNCAQARSLK
ncbi:hypothetical protein [Leptospira stimsonii]|uniref:Lipoprotein n=1 Tax=Leptospira stimsonii TaxID=2202203 RepID=A0ABY2N5D1_9LEPT|nr:hypothetical protein [Leptospira stimsonii]TGK26910.1 hypothetical protein EHO98_00200 [Leptospira stimsonii]TGM17299.1 hypothetical protein EHQ90_07430 [Leptospira stimsonii]